MTIKTIFQILYYLSCVPVVYILYKIFRYFQLKTQFEKEEKPLSPEFVLQGKTLFKRLIIFLIIAIVLIFVFNLIPPVQ